MRLQAAGNECEAATTTASARCKFIRGMGPTRVGPIPRINLHLAEAVVVAASHSFPAACRRIPQINSHLAEDVRITIYHSFPGSCSN